MTKPSENEQSKELLKQLEEINFRLKRLENPYWWRTPDAVRSAPNAETKALLDRLEGLDKEVSGLRKLVDSLAERYGIIGEVPAASKASDVPQDFKEAADRAETLMKDVRDLLSLVEPVKKLIIDREHDVQRKLEETVKQKPDSEKKAVRELGENALKAREKVAKNQDLALNAWVKSVERESDAFINAVQKFFTGNKDTLLVDAIYRFKQQLELFDSQLPREHFEQQVQEFYDYASISYETLMGNRWHTGDPNAEDAGFSIVEACAVLEERVIRLTGIVGDGAGKQDDTGAKDNKEKPEIRRVFDFGSGIGGPTLHMAKFVQDKIKNSEALKARISEVHFVGVTNNGRLNARAQQRAAELKLSNVAEFVTLDDVGYKNLPRDKFPDESFDAATFFESVCHLTDKAALFHEIFRILKPGARLAGIDWIQRRFREIQTELQIMEHMKWVNDFVRIPWHGTVEGYKDMMVNAGFEVLLAEDLWEGIECWGSTPPQDAQGWRKTEGLGAELFVKGKMALDAARRAGVFSIGLWVARKPLTSR